MKLAHIQEANILSTEFIDLVTTLLDIPERTLHSRLIDIQAVPEAVRQLTRAFGEPHINKGSIKGDHGVGDAIPRSNIEDSPFVAYSWEKVPARYVAIDMYTDGRYDTAEIYVDKRGMK